MVDLRAAQQLRRDREYDEALVMYREAWDEKPDAGIAASIINCLRGLGRLAEAEEFYQQAIEACTVTPWLKTEHVWTLYAKYIKPIEVPTKDLFLQKAEEVMALTQDLLPRKLTAFKVTDVLAREPSPDWEAVRSWLERIQDVEVERTTIDPGKKLSDKRKWYFKYTKALAKLGEYELSREYCRKARNIFKTAHFFSHRAAKCARARGDLATAREEYEALIGVHDEWYVHADLAELLFTLGQYAPAEQHAVTAILACRNMQLKVRAFFLWAQILAHTDPPLAWLPLHFHILFRQERGWPIGDEVLALAKEHPVPSGEQASGAAELEERVEALARQRNAAEDPKKRGFIKNLQEKFGFIHAEDGTDIFFSRGSCRGANLHPGGAVTFRVKRAYDRRKKRESLEAYDVEIA
ncbi:MAG: hypothetical protein GF418_15120 [Chitinivibrionales bacterium]|nr:hypothetical protein [Chitinivibrionales bacterium]MBD3396952.1 hypothetical protein [Chitinivibrionales bacterium]